MKLLCSKCGAWNEDKPLATILQRCDECGEVMAAINMGGPPMSEEQTAAGKTKQSVWVESKQMIEVKVPDAMGSLILEPKIFSSGSCGYGFNGKITLNGEKFQVGVNMVLVGSKDWDNGTPAAEAKPKAKAK